MGDKMTFRVSIKHIDDNWYVNIDTIDGSGKWFTHSGRVVPTAKAATEFLLSAMEGRDDA